MWVCVYFVNNCSFVLCFVDFLIKSYFKKIAKVRTLKFDFQFDLLHSDSKQYVHVYPGKI